MIINNIVITRSKIYGINKNIGGLETYLKAFCEEGSNYKPIILISGSGTYAFTSGQREVLQKGFKTSNPYLLTFLTGIRSIKYVSKIPDMKVNIFSFGLSGIFIPILKKILKNNFIKFNVILFGLEFMIPEKSRKAFFTQIQHKVGLRKALGRYILKNSDCYFTEYPNHALVYEDYFPFLKHKKSLCLPDPIFIKEFNLIEKIIYKKLDNFFIHKEINFISVGRDSSDKRREASIDLFNILATQHKELKFCFNICVPKASNKLKEIVNKNKEVKLHESLTDREIEDIRKKSLFCISHSNQKVPLLSILEDMSYGIIPISNDNLGGSIDDKSAFIIDDKNIFLNDFARFIKKDLSYDKFKNAYYQSKKFDRENFSKTIKEFLT